MQNPAAQPAGCGPKPSGRLKRLGHVVSSMIRKSAMRFSEKIMLNQESKAR
jgi:hypothetical protein